jgi:hypothetical protein
MVTIVVTSQNLKKKKRKLAHSLMAARVSLFLFIHKMSPKRRIKILKIKNEMTFDGLNCQE